MRERTIDPPRLGVNGSACMQAGWRRQLTLHTSPTVAKETQAPFARFKLTETLAA